MKSLKVNLVIIDKVDEVFDISLRDGEEWAFKEYERQLASRLGVTAVRIEEILDDNNDLELPKSKWIDI